MMTPEKATMADLSGGKRDRRSDDTDDPVTTPNTRDTKLSCWDPDDARGGAYDAETGENGKGLGWNDSPKGDHDDAPMTGGLTAPKDQSVTDVDGLISPGGGDPGDPPLVLRTTTPKKLFFAVEDEDDDGDIVASDDDVATKDLATESDNASTTTKLKLTNDNNTITNKIITKKTTENKNKKNQNNNNNIHDTTIDPNEFILVTSKSSSNLDLSTLSAHSAKWKKLDDHSRKLSPFGDNDRPAILREI